MWGAASVPVEVDLRGVHSAGTGRDDWRRDLVFPTSRWLPPLRRRMVRTMVGLDRGIVRRAIPLDELRRLALPAAVPAAVRG